MPLSQTCESERIRGMHVHVDDTVEAPRQPWLDDVMEKRIGRRVQWTGIERLDGVPPALSSRAFFVDTPKLHLFCQLGSFPIRAVCSWGCRTHPRRDNYATLTRPGAVHWWGPRWRGSTPNQGTGLGETRAHPGCRRARGRTADGVGCLPNDDARLAPTTNPLCPDAAAGT